MGKKKNKNKGKRRAGQMTGDSKAPAQKNGFIGLAIGICVGLVAVGAVIALVRKRRHEAEATSKSESDSSPSLQLGSNAPESVMEHFSVGIDAGTWDTHGEIAHSGVDNGRDGGAAA